MVYCFAPTCNHASESHTCQFFAFPSPEKATNEHKRWIRLIRLVIIFMIVFLLRIQRKICRFTEWFASLGLHWVVIFGRNTTSDISKLLHVIWRAVTRMKFETNLKYHERYLWQISITNHAIICLYYYPQRVGIFTCRYFKLSWNTTALSQSNCSNFSCSSVT